METEATAHDLVVGPVIHQRDEVDIWLSAAHESGGTARIRTNGVELFSLYLEDYHWPEFAYEESDQEQVLRELVSLAAVHLLGGTTERTERRRLRKHRVGLVVPWEGKTFMLTSAGRHVV